VIGREYSCPFQRSIRVFDEVEALGFTPARRGRDRDGRSIPSFSYRRRLPPFGRGATVIRWGSQSRSGHSLRMTSSEKKRLSWFGWTEAFRFSLRPGQCGLNVDIGARVDEGGDSGFILPAACSSSTGTISNRAKSASRDSSCIQQQHAEIFVELAYSGATGR
jgi:hypothetical protein